MIIKRLGTSGSLYGTTVAQQQAFADILQRVAPDELHHGVANGWDAMAHSICRELFGNLIKIHGWPPIDQSRMNFDAYFDLDVTHPAMDFKVRDREIVWVTQALVGVPRKDTELARSGTYYTMRQAWAISRPVTHVKLDGSYKWGEWKSELNERYRARESAAMYREHPMEVIEGALVRGVDSVNARLQRDGLPLIELAEWVNDDELVVVREEVTLDDPFFN